MNKKRVLAVYFLFLYTVLFLTARFFVIAKNGTLTTHTLSEQYIRRMDIAKRNGFIFDRNGEALDVQKDGFITIVDPTDLTSESIEELSEKLSAHSGERQSFFVEKLLTGKPFTVVTDADVFHESCLSFVKYKESGDTLCHLLGYRNSEGYGVSGIMQAYDEFLSNYAAGNVFIRYKSDALGKCAINSDIEVFDNGYSSSDGIYLTIDADIQKAVEKICESHLDMGAVVVQDTHTGEIYAMASRPFYDKEKLSEYLDSDRGELLNRSLLCYTPGSVFKTVVAAAALSEQFFDPETVYECKGYVEIDGHRIKCHNLQGHGKLDLKQAFAQSCNPFFIELGCRIGSKKLIETANKMGIGRYDSINLISCGESVLPDNDSISVIANMSVGQGKVLLSPVQVCTMMSTAATGIYSKPTVVSKTVLGEDVTDYSSYGEESVFDKKTTEFLKDMLLACVTDGTGYRADSALVKTAGKTATAQSGQLKNGKEVIHSWFAGFFPYDYPRFTVCVLCDGNGEGNSHPSEIFRLIAEEITRIENNRQE